MSRPIALDVLSSAVCVESPGSAGSRGCRWPKCSFLCTRASAPRRCWERSNSARRGPSWCLGRSSCVRAERRRVRACSRATPRQASPLAFLTRCALQTGSDASCDTADAWQGSVSRGPRCSALHTHPGTLASRAACAAGSRRLPWTNQRLRTAGRQPSSCEPVPPSCGPGAAGMARLRCARLVAQSACAHAALFLRRRSAAAAGILLAWSAPALDWTICVSRSHSFTVKLSAESADLVQRLWTADATRTTRNPGATDPFDTCAMRERSNAAAARFGRAV